MNADRAVLVLLLASGLAVTGCSGDGTPSTSDATSPSPTVSPSTAASAAGPSSVAPTSGGSTTPGATGSTITASPVPDYTPPSFAPGASSSPAASPPPAPANAAPEHGRYPVTIQGSERFGPRGGQQVTRVYPPSSYVDYRAGGSAARRVLVVHFSAERDDTVTIDLSGAAVRLVRADARFAYAGFDQTTTFAPSPPVTLLPAGARVGQRFSGRYDGTARGTYTGRVLRRETLRIGGAAVQTLVVEWSTTFSGAASGSLRSTTWWDAARRLPVKQRTVTDGGDAFNTYHQDATVTLRRLTPDPA